MAGASTDARRCQPKGCRFEFFLGAQTSTLRFPVLPVNASPSGALRSLQGSLSDRRTDENRGFICAVLTHGSEVRNAPGEPNFQPDSLPFGGLTGADSSSQPPCLQEFASLGALFSGYLPRTWLRLSDCPPELRLVNTAVNRRVARS